MAHASVHSDIISAVRHVTSLSPDPPLLFEAPTSPDAFAARGCQGPAGHMTSVRPGGDDITPQGWRHVPPPGAGLEGGASGRGILAAGAAAAARREDGGRRERIPVRRAVAGAA